MEPERCAFGSSSHRRAAVLDVARVTAAVILDRKVSIAALARRCGCTPDFIARFLRDVVERGYTPLDWGELRPIQRAAWDMAGVAAVSSGRPREGGLGVMEYRYKAADPAWREREIQELERRYACR